MDANENGDLKSKALRWFLGQEANTILLFLILAGISWMLHYSITEAIPAHLKQIGEGYKAVAEENRAAQREQQATFERTTEKFERTMERNDGLVRDVLQLPRRADGGGE